MVNRFRNRGNEDDDKRGDQRKSPDRPARPAFGRDNDEDTGGGRRLPLAGRGGPTGNQPDRKTDDSGSGRRLPFGRREAEEKSPAPRRPSQGRPGTPSAGKKDDKRKSEGRRLPGFGKGKKDDDKPPASDRPGGGRSPFIGGAPGRDSSRQGSFGDRQSPGADRDRGTRTPIGAGDRDQRGSRPPFGAPDRDRPASRTPGGSGLRDQDDRARPTGSPSRAPGGVFDRDQPGSRAPFGTPDRDRPGSRTPGGSGLRDQDDRARPTGSPSRAPGGVFDRDQPGSRAPFGTPDRDRPGSRAPGGGGLRDQDDRGRPVGSSSRLPVGTSDRDRPGSRAPGGGGLRDQDDRARPAGGPSRSPFGTPDRDKPGSRSPFGTPDRDRPGSKARPGVGDRREEDRARPGMGPPRSASQPRPAFGDRSSAVRSPVGTGPQPRPGSRAAGATKPEEERKSRGLGILGRGSKGKEGSKKPSGSAVLDRAAGPPARPAGIGGARTSAIAPAAPARSKSAAAKGRDKASTARASRAKSVAKPLPEDKRGPRIVSRGMDLDRKLDLIGVGLVVLGGIMLFGILPSMSFGILPPAEGGLTGTVNHILSQLFGWGKIVWPLVCFTIGIWLMLRYFGGQMFEVDYFRIVGALLLFSCALTGLHMIQLVDDTAPTVEVFRPISYDLAIDQGQGGGWFGHTFYVFLLSQLGDWGTFSFLIGWLVVGLMLTLDVSVVELGQFIGGVLHLRRTGSRADRRAAREAAKADTVAVVRPGEALAVGAAAGVVAATATAPSKSRKKSASPAPAPAAAATTAPATGSQRPMPLAPAVVGPAETEGVDETRSQPLIRRRSGPPGTSESAEEDKSPSALAEKEGPSPAGAPEKSEVDKQETASPSRRLGLLRGKSDQDQAAAPGDKPAEPIAAPATKSEEASERKSSGRLNSLLRKRSQPAAEPSEDLTSTAGSQESKTETTSATKTGETPPPRRLPVPGRPGPFSADTAEPADSEAGPDTQAPERAARASTETAPTEPPSVDKPATDPAERRAERPGMMPRRTSPFASPTRPDDESAAPLGPERSSPFGPARRRPIGLDEETKTIEPPLAAATALEDQKKEEGKEEATGPSDDLALRDRPLARDPSLRRRSPFSRLEEADGAVAMDARDNGDNEEPESSTAPPEGRPARAMFVGRGSPGTRPQEPETEAAARPSLDDVATIELEGEKEPEEPKARPAGLFRRSQPDSRQPSRPAAESPAPTSSAESAPALVNKEPEDGKEEADELVLTLDPPSAAPPAAAAAVLLSDEEAEEPEDSPVEKPVPARRANLPPTGLHAAASATPAVAPPSPTDAGPSPAQEGPPPRTLPQPGPRPGDGPRPAVSPPVREATVPPAAPRDRAPLPSSGDHTPALNRPAQTPPADRPRPMATHPQEEPRRTGMPVRPQAGGGDGTPALPRSAGPAKTGPGTPGQYELPDFRRLLRRGSEQRINDEILLDKARVIEDTLQAFGAPGKVVEVNPGPVITQFGVEPDYLISRSGKKTRIKVGSIARLDADLALALAAKTIRIEAPVPGKGFVGIEVPNDEVQLVSLYDIMDSPEFRRIDSKLRLALGLSVDGTPVSADLTAMPHLLIAGTTGSGKSVCVNAIISCLLLSNTPDELQFIMVDPKRVELTGYNGIPHLVAPVVTDLERIVGVLQWIQREMEERYRKFASITARNIVDYNHKIGPNEKKLPYYVVVVDELADLMMLAPDETERLLARLAQMARATGIHLIISTQRPSVDIITGLIKANFPARIAFAVASSVDSRVILDQPGAEKLLGRGDMLYQSPEAAAPMRMQGVYVSDDEINNITRYWKGLLVDEVEPPGVETLPLPSRETIFAVTPTASPAAPAKAQPADSGQRAFWDETGATAFDSEDNENGNEDELYNEAVELVQKLDKASISLLQRRLRIGYTRAARLIDIMEREGVVGPAESGSKPREVLKRG